MTMLDGLTDLALGPRRKILIKHPPTLEWVTHGCVECGHRHSFAWFSIPYQDTEAPVCGDCYGATYDEVHGPRWTVSCGICGVVLGYPQSGLHESQLISHGRVHVNAHKTESGEVPDFSTDNIVITGRPA